MVEPDVSTYLQAPSVGQVCLRQAKIELFLFFFFRSFVFCFVLFFLQRLELTNGASKLSKVKIESAFSWFFFGGRRAGSRFDLEPLLEARAVQG